MARTRVTVKPAGSTRHRASATISRAKAKQKHARQRKRRAVVVAVAVSCAVLGGGGFWLKTSGTWERTTTALAQGMWEMTARAGFGVRQVTLEGRQYVPQAQLKEAIAVAQGDPILGVSLAQMHTRLLALPEVRNALVTRQLPHDISVVIEERVPVALWQHQGEYVPVDAEGVILSRRAKDLPQGLLLVVGEDAPKHMSELTALLADSAAVSTDIDAAIRVGERRWNMRMKGGMTVMLPEQGAEQAWRKFVALAKQQGLMSKALKTVDMRVEDRVFVTPANADMAPKLLTSAHDT